MRAMVAVAFAVGCAHSEAPAPAPVAEPTASSSGVAAPHRPPPGAAGPRSMPDFPAYAAHPDPDVDALATATSEARDELCQSYCAASLGWSAEHFVDSRIDDFYQTPEAVDLRCNFAETDRDIGGSEKHLGGWIRGECAKRSARACYWSINYAPPHQGRVACVRAVFAP